MMELSLARIKTALVGAGRQKRYSAVMLRPPRALEQVVPTPPHIVSEYEEQIRDTGAFVMEGDVTGWNWQPGTETARLDIQDYHMNAAMQSSGQTNCNLNIPVGVANYVPPRGRVRITLEVVS